MAKIIKQLRQFIAEANPCNRNEMATRKIADNVDYYSLESEEAIRQRIQDLNNEWDAERVGQFNTSVLVLAGIVLAAAIHKKWLILPAAISAFMAVNAVKGGSVPLPATTKLRTRHEIALEQAGLSAILKEQRFNKLNPE